jgi:DNA replication protein DnaC
MSLKIKHFFPDYEPSTLRQDSRICNKHNEQYAVTLFEIATGSKWLGYCPACREEEKIADIKQEEFRLKLERKQRQIVRLFHQAAIPPRFADANFANYVAETAEKQRVKSIMQDFADNIDANLGLGKNMILSGKPGTGKTHLAIAIAKTAIDNGNTALFTTAATMINKINAAGWNKGVVIVNYIMPDLLILDDVMCGFNNVEQMNLFEVLNGRYVNKKSTIIQTNLGKDDLRVVMGERVIDRLRDDNGVVLNFTWGSYRK